MQTFVPLSENRTQEKAAFGELKNANPLRMVILRGLWETQVEIAQLLCISGFSTPPKRQCRGPARKSLSGVGT